MPQRSVNFAPDFRALPGQIMSAEYNADSKIYALLAMAWTVTFGGTASDGDYDYRVNGNRVRTTRTSGSPASNTNLATQNVLDGEAVAALDNVAAFSSSGAVVTVTALHTDDELVVDQLVAPGSGTLAAAITVPLYPAILPVGIGVVRSSTAGQIRIPQSGDDDAAFAGIAIRNEQNMRPARPGATEVDGYEGGAVVSVGYRGDFAVLVDDTVAEGDQAHYRITGTGPGNFGNDTASGARVALTGARFITPTLPLPYNLLANGATGIAIVRLNRP